MPFDSSVIADTLHKAPQALADTVRTVVAAEHAEPFSFTHLFNHLKDSHEVETPFGHIELPHIPPLHIGGVTIDLSITKHIFFLWVAASILIFIGITSARKYKKSLVPSGMTSAVETVVIFIRDEIVLSTMGTGGLKYLPYLITTFCFILIMNLLGLVPYGVTSTANIAVTAGLAFISFVMIQVAAIRAQGVKKYLEHLTGGVPWFLWPIMIPTEFIGMFTKPFALCLRLFANMNGGHMVLLSFIGLIFIFKSYLVSPVPVLFAVGISLLEIIVAFLQAYIFTILTALFMGTGIQAAEHADHGH
jgi:F-type H+-transporting ATPase subunit a